MKNITINLAKTLVIFFVLNSVTLFSQTHKSDEEFEKVFGYWLKGMDESRIAVGAENLDFLVFQRFYEKELDAERGKFLVAVGTGEINMDNVQLKMDEEKKQVIALYKKYLVVKKEFPSSLEEYKHPFPIMHGSSCDSTGCTNINFEQGTLSGWDAYYGYNNNNGTYSFFNVTNVTGGPAGAVTEAANDVLTSNPAYYNASVGASPSPDYQISITHGSGGDVLVPSVPRVSPFGGTYSAMVGDSTLRNYGVAILSKTFYVTPTNDNFTYQYAVFLENPSSHGYYQQPFFKAAVLDQNGDTIPYCGQYSVVSGGGLQGFKAVYYPLEGDSVYYKNWTLVSVPLKKYVGTCVTIVFETGDCAIGGHFGYAYVDASCAPLGIITSSPAICGNKSITLTAPGGFNGYSWIGPTNGIISNDTLQAIKVDSAGTYSVIVTPVTGASCADTLSITVTKVPGTVPIPSFMADTVCVGQATSFINTSNPSSGSFYWDFYNLGTYQDSTANATWTYNNTGTYSVKLYEVNGGCGADTVIKVKVDSASIAAFAAPNSCLGVTTSFTNSSKGASSYSWNFGEPSSGVNNTSSLANPSHTYGSAGTYTIVLVTKVGGSSCADTAKEVITISPSPTVSITGNHSICAGTNTVLTASGTGISTYSWAPGGKTSASVVVNPTVNTIYTVTVSNGSCSVSDTFAVIVTPKASVTITGTNIVCQGDSVTLTANGTAGNYTWNNGSTTSTITVTVSKDSTYYVVVTKGCADTAYHPMTVIPVTGIVACCDTTIDAGGTAHIGATGTAVGYVWSPSSTVDCYTCPNTTATPTVNTTYTVTGTDSNGCRSYATVTVEIACSNYFVPNVFTPNGDGQNDNFLIKAYNLASYNIEIYDRWGVLMYKSDTPYAPWDGTTTGGSKAPDGVYYYIIKSKCGTTENDHHGFVQIIRN